jgi:hypothetical protein
MKIINRNSIGSIGADDQGAAIRYCPACERYHIKRKLGPRLNYFAEDADHWLQCYACGKIIPKYAAKEEGHIEAVITVQDNPFSDLNTSIKGVQSRGGKRGTIHSQRKSSVMYKDPEVNEAVRKGGKVLSYTEK